LKLNDFSQNNFKAEHAGWSSNISHLYRGGGGGDTRLK
jgi:hypothetical protein